MRQIPPRETRAAPHAAAGRPAGVPRSGRQARRRGRRAAMRRSGRWSLPLRLARTSRCLRPIHASSSMSCRQAPPAGRIAVGRRRWRADDLPGAALAVGALAGEEAASRSPRRPAAHGVPVNIVDTPELSTFSFGSIVNRSPVVIGICHRRRRAGPGAGDPRQDRGVAASGARRLGRGGAAPARDRQGAAAHGSSAPRPVAPVRGPGARGPRAPTAQDLARPHRLRHPATAARSRWSAPGRAIRSC